jgi:putative flippase GtrA
MEEDTNENKKNEQKIKTHYNLIEFLSIICVIVLQNILNLLVSAEFYIIIAALSFASIYIVKFFIDRHLNFHLKWEKYKEDNYFYVLYGIIALGAGILYVAVQYVLEFDLLYSILAGGVALTFKKIADQEYGLFFRERIKELTLYGFFAIFTTLIFWGVQYSLTLIIGVEYYIIAGAIGLAIGYTVKFVLDKFYVFKKKYGSTTQQTMFYVLYVLFGFISSVINLGVQWLLGYNIIGVLSGTIVGFLVKYLLDKFIIFRKKSK